jgi:AbrB family looped-hinge helix DNA binding protein
MTITKNFQVVIPVEVREKLHLKIGQKMSIEAKAGFICLIPQRTLASYRGFLKKRSAFTDSECEDR